MKFAYIDNRLTPIRKGGPGSGRHPEGKSKEKSESKKLSPKDRKKMIDAMVQAQLDAQRDEKFSDNIDFLRDSGMSDNKVNELEDNGDSEEVFGHIERILTRDYTGLSDKDLQQEHKTFFAED